MSKINRFHTISLLLVFLASILRTTPIASTQFVTLLAAKRNVNIFRNGLIEFLEVFFSYALTT